MMEHITTKNGVSIPVIGFGTWQITDRGKMIEVIRDAYDAGYRLIDTAAAYSNEIAISKAIETAGIPREEILISDKVWNTSRGYDEVQEACRKSLKKLKTDYLDLYLIHWPASKKLYENWGEINAETWRGMERLLTDGLVKEIGVCNFKIHHLEELNKSLKIKPAVNQMEIHPGSYPKEIITYCIQNGICVEASSPLGSGQILSDRVLNEIAKAHNRTVAQVCIRWILDKGVIAIPKSTYRSRIQDNIRVFDFSLSLEETEAIDNLPFCGGLGIDSDEVVSFG